MADYTGPLYNLVNKAYVTFREHAPEPVREFMDEHPEASAAILGFTGAFLLTETLQWTADKILGEKLSDKVMPPLEKMVNAALVVAPITLSILEPEWTRETFREHSVYTSGMIAATAGTFVANSEDANNRDRRASYKRGRLSSSEE